MVEMVDTMTGIKQDGNDTHIMINSDSIDDDDDDDDDDEDDDDDDDDDDDGDNPMQK